MEEQRSLPRFSCNYAVSSARRTPPSKSPEPPSETSNLSPEPIPKKGSAARLMDPEREALEARSKGAFTLAPAEG